MYGCVCVDVSVCACVCVLRVATEMVSFVVCIIGNINDLIFYIFLYWCTELFLDLFFFSDLLIFFSMEPTMCQVFLVLSIYFFFI